MGRTDLAFVQKSDQGKENSTFGFSVIKASGYQLTRDRDIGSRIAHGWITMICTSVAHCKFVRPVAKLRST